MQIRQWTSIFAAALLLLASASCSNSDDGGVTDPNDSENVQVNKNVHQYLSERYLWNSEYNTLTPNYDQDYKAFLSNQLLRLTTNVLDKKADADGKYSLYSYIQLHNGVAASDGETADIQAKVAKEEEYSYGFTGFGPVALAGSDSAAQVYFCVRGVYPGSHAERQGLQRGDMIESVNGVPLTTDNYVSLYYSLLQPTAAATASIGVRQFQNNVPAGLITYTVNCTAAYCNPILYNKVVDTLGTKVGYLVYDNFDAGYEEELYNVFADFKSQGISDLILDFRYNRGGRTTSANLLATCIAGAQSQGKVFSSFAYNLERMAKRGGKRDDTNFAYPSFDNLGRDITAACLGLSRVYVLTTKATASASELVINALRGIGVEVVLVGKQTEGKNVGMELKDISTTYGNTYRLAPITFQVFNANGESDYADGFAPTVELEETNPYNHTATFYVYRPYGSAGEPLYATALSLITGGQQNGVQKVAAVSKGASGQQLPTPQLERLGHSGIIK